MKKYEIPTIEVLSLAVEDVMAASGGNWWEGTPGEDD